MTRRTWRRIRLVIIWAAIPILIWTGPADATHRAAISATHAVFLLAAPVWCAAQNRGGTYCRKRTRPGSVRRVGGCGGGHWFGCGRGSG